VAYRNAWWIVEPGRTLTGLGIFGQFCWVDRPSRTVIARFSTWPDAYPEPVSVACLRVMRAIADGLD
jgi:CubicO group peptidase (beta-lactamase class C family)